MRERGFKGDKLVCAWNNLVDGDANREDCGKDMDFSSKGRAFSEWGKGAFNHYICFI